MISARQAPHGTCPKTGASCTLKDNWLEIHPIRPAALGRTRCLPPFRNSGQNGDFDTNKWTGNTSLEPTRDGVPGTGNHKQAIRNACHGAQLRALPVQKSYTVGIIIDVGFGVT